MEFLKFFNQETMSVHLKQGQKPLGKIGKPGSFSLQIIDDVTTSESYLEKIISVKIVEGVEEAVNHINTFGSGHTDSIITENIYRSLY